MYDSQVHVVRDDVFFCVCDLAWLHRAPGFDPGFVLPSTLPTKAVDSGFLFVYGDRLGQTVTIVGMGAKNPQQENGFGYGESNPELPRS